MVIGRQTRFCRACCAFVAGITAISLLTACGEDEGGTDSLLGDFALDVPIAYIKRPVDSLQDPGGSDVLGFSPGGNVYTREFAASSSTEENITDTLTAATAAKGAGDVSGLDVSYDGTKFVFAVHIGIPVDNNDPQNTWNIWLYDVPNKSLTPLIPQGNGLIIPNEGNDINPMFMPDGSVVFASDRRPDTYQVLFEQTGQSAIDVDLEEETRSDPAFNLHSMVPNDIASLKQITFNQSHDIYPFLIQSGTYAGKIGYLRWDNANGRNHYALHTVNPDGTGMNVLYGAHSHTGTGQDARLMLKPRTMEDGRLIATFLPTTGTFQGGDIVYVDVNNFTETTVQRVTSSSANTNAEQSATGNGVTVAAGISRGGRYTSPFPLWDGTNRALVSWAWCEVEGSGGQVDPCNDNNTNLPPATPAYGLWMLDLNDLTVTPMILPDQNSRTGVIVDAVALINREEQGNVPAMINPQPIITAEATAAESRQRGLLKIRSVYDTTDPRLIENTTPDLNAIMNLPSNQRLVRFIRIVKPAPIPDNSTGGTQNMREFLGYQEVEPDGSVVVEVPANRPFGFELVDAMGRRIRRDTSWLQVKPGETVECNGCHATRTGRPALNSGAPTTGTPFTATTLHSDPMLALSPEMGETMAQTRSRISCAANSACDYQQPKERLFYDDDVWNDPEDADTANDGLDINVSYATLITNPPVLPNANCITGTWDNACRIVINYEDHIQPLWEMTPRLRDDGTGNMVDRQCISCHTEGPWDVNGDGAVFSPPAGQLSLTQTGPIQNNDDRNSTFYASFFELARRDFLQKLDDNGALVYATKDVREPTGMVDANGDPETDLFPRQIQLRDSNRTYQDLPNESAIVGDDSPHYPNPIRSRNNSRNDGPFFRKFGVDPVGVYDFAVAAGANTQDHTGFLTEVEMRLIIEWIDTGARYSNDPFAP